MTAVNSYIAKAGNVAGVAFGGLVRFSVESSASEVDLRGDSKQFQDNIALINCVETLTAEGNDLTVNAVVGTTSTFSLQGIKNTGGVTLSGTLTATGSCTVTSIEHGFDIDGKTTVKVTATILSTAGTASGILWTIV